MENLGTEIKEYIDIKDLKDTYFFVSTTFALINDIKQVNNKIILEVKFNEVVLKNLEYNKSKYFDKKTKLYSARFLSFLEWCYLDNIDKIVEESDNII